jgi:hypothetical protein
MASELSQLLQHLTPAELAELDGLLSDIEVPVWTPLPGPQSAAFSSEADELFYGGAAGGGKTDLLLGTGLQNHWRTIVFRREFQQLKGIKDRSNELYYDIGKYNGSDWTWRFKDGRTIEFGACQFEGDEQKYQGRPHDLKGFDEVTHFTKRQYKFLTGWNRTTKIDPSTGKFYRTRVIACGNPPTTAEGQWVADYWAPWLNPSHPDPALPGELRWFITNSDGDDMEVSSPDPIYMEINGQETEIFPRSRTFIRARIQDNPFLMSSGYISILQALPEPLRSRMLQGDFGIGEDDDRWQVIPTAWILAAQSRWAPTYEQYLLKLISRKAAINPSDPTNAVGSSSPLSGPLRGSGSVSSAVKGHSNNNNTIVEEPKLEEPSEPKRELKPDDLPDLNIPKAQPRTLDEFFQQAGVGVDTSVLLSDDQKKLNYNVYGNLDITKGFSADLPGSRDVGVDVSRGGRDKTVFSERRGSWFATLKLVPGVDTPDGPAVIAKVREFGYADWRVKIDVVGVGSSPVDVGKLAGIDVVAMNGADKSIATDRSGTLSFTNARSEWFWLFREALDPSLGLEIAIPPDSELAADLAAPRWALTVRGIQVEDKKKVKERLGRSPDKGDAVINAFAQPNVAGQGFLHFYRDELKHAEEIARERARTTIRGPYMDRGHGSSGVSHGIIRS